MTRENRIAAMESYWREVMKRCFGVSAALPPPPGGAKRIVSDVEADGTVSYDTLFEFQRLVAMDGNGGDRT